MLYSVRTSVSYSRIPSSRGEKLYAAFDYQLQRCNNVVFYEQFSILECLPYVARRFMVRSITTSVVSTTIDRGYYSNCFIPSASTNVARTIAIVYVVGEFGSLASMSAGNAAVILRAVVRHSS